MSRPEMYAVPLPIEGQLWIMPRPASMGLEAQIQAYKDAGVDHIVSMLTADEASQLGLAQEGRLCTALGMQFTQHPIKDFHLPEPQPFAELIADLVASVTDGNHTAVHCRAGIGRSGMVSCAVLVALGASAEEAINNVSRARGCAVPDTPAQAGFIAMFENTRQL